MQDSGQVEAMTTMPLPMLLLLLLVVVVVVGFCLAARFEGRSLATRSFTDKPPALLLLLLLLLLCNLDILLSPA
jgi:hypothetical protein